MGHHHLKPKFIYYENLGIEVQLDNLARHFDNDNIE